VLCSLNIPAVGVSAVGVPTVDVSTVDVSTVDVSTVGVSTVGVSTVGVSTVGVSIVGVYVVGVPVGVLSINTSVAFLLDSNSKSTSSSNTLIDGYKAKGLLDIVMQHNYGLPSPVFSRLAYYIKKLKKELFS
jgi:hypothetical protein